MDNKDQAKDPRVVGTERQIDISVELLRGYIGASIQQQFRGGTIVG